MKPNLYIIIMCVVLFGITLLNTNPVVYDSRPAYPTLMPMPKLNISKFTFNNFTFDVNSTYGDEDRFNFKVSEAGCISVKIEPWSRSGTSGSKATQLALILKGSDRTTYYSRADGNATSAAPLWTSYSVSAEKVKQVSTWTISVANFTRSGTAKGIVSVEYPPTKLPCELKAIPSRTIGQIDISWSYGGNSFRGFFLVERRNDRGIWELVPACKQSLPTYNITSPRSYSCSDTRLTGGKDYYYRACAITSTTGTSCGTTNITPPLISRAP